MAAGFEITSPLEQADLWLLDLPMVEAFGAGHGAMASRTVTVIRLGFGEAGAGVDGWGECAALPSPTYTAETAAGCFDLLATFLEAALGTSLPGPEELVVPGAGPMARAAVEMALLDAALTRAGCSLAEHLHTGNPPTGVAAGAAVGLGSTAEVTRRVDALVDEGYGRVKLKIIPSHDLAPVRAVLERHPELGVQVDGNGTFGPDGVASMLALAEAGVEAIEQPFAVAETRLAASLVGRLADAELPTRLVADEAVENLADVERLADEGALSGVSIKPGRVGGILPAYRILQRCRQLGLSATAGGMVETSFGRRALAALASCDGFDLTGDLSPASRWLAADPWPDVELVDGQILVPAGPGVGPAPNRELVDRLSVRHLRFAS